MFQLLCLFLKDKNVSSTEESLLGMTEKEQVHTHTLTHSLTHSLTHTQAKPKMEGQLAIGENPLIV